MDWLYSKSSPTGLVGPEPVSFGSGPAAAHASQLKEARRHRERAKDLSA